MAFPDGFIWGAASSAYQIEGAPHEDGGGLSTWDVFSRTPGKTWQGHSGFFMGERRAPVPGMAGQSGDVACGHYHRYREDVSLMKEIGLQGYRLSVSWPRVLPEGTGAVNEKGLDFYDNLIDELLSAGIEPFVTLFHWEYPYTLYRRGGWLNRESVSWFGEYASAVVKRLSDRVQYWMPINEMKALVGLGHQIGLLAPGLQLPFADVLLVAHHVLLAHGTAVQVIRANAKKPPVIGQVTAGGVSLPRSTEPSDIEAARRSCFAIHAKTATSNSWYLDPMFLGHYPEDGMELFREDLPEMNDADLDTIHQPLDLFGLNVYEGRYVEADGSESGPEPFGVPMTAYRMAVTPSVLYWGPKFFFERYRKPIYVTENGMSNLDWVARDGKVHDPQRIDYVARYLRELERASEDGVDIRGYFYWSVMDVFEWHEGYRQRFGLIHVDFPTGERTLKDSAHWYKRVIASNGANMD